MVDVEVGVVVWVGLGRVKSGSQCAFPAIQGASWFAHITILTVHKAACKGTF